MLWNDLTQGVQVGAVRIRLAQAKDRPTLTRLLNLATHSPTLDRVYRQSGNTGELVGAYRNRDERKVRDFWFGRELTDDEVVRGATCLLVATRNGKVVGALCAGAPWRFLAENELDVGNLVVSTFARLSTVAVEQSERGHGIGRALVDTAVDLFDRAGYTAMYGQCDEDLRGFYEEAGFRVSSPGAVVALSRSSPFTRAISSDDDECIVVREFRPYKAQAIAWRVPMLHPAQLQVPDPAPTVLADDSDIGGQRAIVLETSTDQPAPTLVMGLHPNTVALLAMGRVKKSDGDALSGLPASKAFVVEADVDGIYLGLNDRTKPLEEERMVVVPLAPVRMALWARAAADREETAVVVPTEDGGVEGFWVPVVISDELLSQSDELLSRSAQRLSFVDRVRLWFAPRAYR